jgi:hypothetical protein
MAKAHHSRHERKPAERSTNDQEEILRPRRPDRSGLRSGLLFAEDTGGD